MSKLTFELTGELTPESKAAVIAEVVRFMATKMEPVPYGAVLAHLMDHFKAPEEDVSEDVQHATFTLLLSGLITSNHYNPEKRLASFQQGTTVSPSQNLTSFMWDEPEWSSDREIFR